MFGCVCLVCGIGRDAVQGQCGKDMYVSLCNNQKCCRLLSKLNVINKRKILLKANISYR